MTTWLLAAAVSLATAQSSQSTDGYDALMARANTLAAQGDLVGAEDALRSAAAARPDSIEPLLGVAQIELAAGQPEQALSTIDQALELARGDFGALLLRGTALIQLGKFDDAVIELTAACDEAPDSRADEGCRTQLALASLRAGQPSVAASVLASVVELGASQDPSVYAMFGAAQVELGRNQASLASLERALALDAQQMQAALYLGRAYLALGRFEEAAASFQTGTSLTPPRQVRYVLGLAEARIGRQELDEAQQLLEALVAQHPRVVRGYFLLGMIQADHGKYQEAASLFQQAIDHGYERADAYLNLGIAYASLDQEEAALEALDEAIERDPTLAAAYYYKGVTELEVGTAWEAIELLKKSASLEPDEPRTFLALAEAHLKLGQFIQALDAATKASESSSLGGRAHYTLGLVHHERLEYKDAAAAYREALALGLDEPHVHLNLGRSLYAMAAHEEAEKSVAAVLQHEPHNAEALLLQGKVGLELRHYEAALENLDQAVELLPDNPESWFRRGVAHSRMRDTEAAISDWRQALALDPDLIDAYYRLGRALVEVGQAEEGEQLLAEFQTRSKQVEQDDQRKAQLRTTVRRAIELADQRRDDEAQALFNEALGIDDTAALTYLAMADFYTRRGRAGDAEAILLRGLSVLPDDVSLGETLLSLYRVVGNEQGVREQKARLEKIKEKP